jgi:DNA-binding response OmpR family regulator
VVEARLDRARHVSALLTLHGYDVDSAATSVIGAEKARVRRPDLLLVSLDVDEGLSDPEALQPLGSLGIVTVVCAGFRGDLARRTASALQVHSMLNSPVTDSQLLRAIRAALSGAAL